MAGSYIGKTISLLSISDVRYRGILAGLDPANSTIQLQNVYSMGTETRRPPEEYIAPAELPYQYIIFRASEVKDIALDNPEPPLRSVHDDPAVIGASGPPMAGYGQFSGPPPYQGPPPVQQPAATPDQTQPNVTSPAAPAPQPSTNGERSSQPVQSGGRETSANGRRTTSNSVSNAAVSLEKVERALGDLRLAQAQQAQAVSPANGSRGTRRGGQKHNEIKLPLSDFDFQSANARFDKAALSGGRKSAQSGDGDEHTNPSEDEADEQSKSGSNKGTKDKGASAPAYNPTKSFFDTLSSSANGPVPGAGGRGRGGRGTGKSRREEEREKNVATFGEPGGVGFMGPNAYVGGYGRRGGGRGGRRGGGRRNAGGERMGQSS